MSKTFDITNTGNLLLTLTKAAPPTAPFQVPDPVSEGQQIEPGDVIHQSVTFSPTKIGAFDGTYSITGNDGKGAHLITVHGQAVTTPVNHAITGLGTCVDVRKGKAKNGTAVQLYTCNQTGSQSWVHDGNTFRALGKCLDVKKSGTKNKTKVQLWGCNGTGAGLGARGERLAGEQRLRPVPGHPARNLEEEGPAADLPLQRLRWAALVARQLS